MCELLRSHEQEIVDRVVLHLGTLNPNLMQPSATSPQAAPNHSHMVQTQQIHSGINRILELEHQLEELRREMKVDTNQSPQRNLRVPSMSTPIHTQLPPIGESASGMVDSVDILFPGIERATLVQIIENKFKPINIYRFLASEQERAESHRIINIGGVEFEQAEREGKESEYRMSGFFKAWAAYSDILVKLAPHLLPGELATALSIYTMNLYDLLEKYTWEGVKAYHFQFHRKRVASGKSIYQPLEWRQLDSELVASKCFAHPHSTPRATWAPGQKQAVVPFRRSFDLPIRENVSGLSYTNVPIPTTENPFHTSNQITAGLGYQTRGSAGGSQALWQTCRNWNF